MDDKRQYWIRRLEPMLNELRNEEAHQEEVGRIIYRLERDFIYFRREYGDDLAQIKSQIRALRDEIRANSQEPVRCAYTNDRGNVLEMLSGLPGRVDDDIKYIKKKSHSNDWMIVVDPYFLQWSGHNKVFESEQKYIDFIVNFIPLNLKKLEIFALPGPHKRVFKKFNDAVKSRGTHVNYWGTSEIHDRVIIRDNNTATLMGTSFGGYANKLSFVLDIPPKDLEQFMGELERIRNSSAANKKADVN